MKKALVILIVLTQFLVLQSQDCESISLSTRSIKASATDSDITWELFDHKVYLNSECESTGKLLVHFVGSFDNPKNTTYFPIVAANNGFKVIVLKYPNNVSVVGACGKSTDTACFSKYRQEIIFGTDASTEVNVDSTDCIINRLHKLLSYLIDNYPEENWNEYLSESQEILWTNILTSGHSQGGGHAAYLAKIYSITRALMFASPNDFSMP